MMWSPACSSFFFFNDTATTEIYTLSLHDALPISMIPASRSCPPRPARCRSHTPCSAPPRSEEHTSELQSRLHLVCRLLLEKKKKNRLSTHPNPVCPDVVRCRGLVARRCVTLAVNR